jgi:hypothetical protein
MNRFGGFRFAGFEGDQAGAGSGGMKGGVGVAAFSWVRQFFNRKRCLTNFEFT